MLKLKTHSGFHDIYIYNEEIVLNSYTITCIQLQIMILDKAANTKKGRMFSEGWIEFEDKKVAKTVASKLNNAQIGGKKKSRWYDEIWNLKYLHRYNI